MKNEAGNYFSQNYSISTMNALLKEYSENKRGYLKLFNENNTQSVCYQFLEGLYKKYSKSLEVYMKKNQQGMRLKGSKKFDNLPIDLFLKESKTFKEAIINELHDKYNKKGALLTLGDIILTPLPDKPRVLLTTQQEKNEFQTAERVAVVMRTVEYTNIFKSQTNQYALMKNEERVQMLYIIKKASSIIQNWWFTKGKEGAKRRRKQNAVGNKGKSLRLFKKRLGIINDTLFNLKQFGWNKLKLLYIQTKYTIYSNELALINNKKLKIKRLFYQWEYYTRGAILLNNSNSGSSDINCNNRIGLITILQRGMKQFLSNKCKTNIKQSHLRKLINKKTIWTTNHLLKAFFYWFHIINYFNSKYYYNTHSNNNHSKSSLPLWYSYLPNILNYISTKRLEEVLFTLKFIQQNQKGLLTDDKFISRKKKINTQKMNQLLKILTIRNKKNNFWKVFQLWNLLNTILHIFVNKIENSFLERNKRLFCILFKKIIHYDDKQQQRDIRTNQHYIINKNVKENKYYKDKKEVLLRYNDNILEENI